MQSGGLVLVTGVSGFIAKHVVPALLEAGYNVRGTVRYASRREEMLRRFRQAGLDPTRVEIVKADLTEDDNWDAAASGCRFVLHVASPFPRRMPFDKYGLVDVARGGTLRVLRAAAKAGAERVIVTSSVAAVYYGHPDRGDVPFTEADFSNVDSPSIGSYAVSKTLAERAAWDFAAAVGLDLVTMNPSVVLGPLTDDDHGTSVWIVRMMMRGRLPFVPRLSVGVVDVRDVAEAHVRALAVSAAAGRRFILSAGSLTMLEIGRAAGEVATGSPLLPKANLPDIAVKLAGRFSAQALQLVPELGRVKPLCNRPSRELLGLTYRDPRDAVRATAESLIQRGLAAGRRH